MDPILSDGKFLRSLFPCGNWGTDDVDDEPMVMNKDGTWVPKSATPDGGDGQDARAGIGPAQASHGQAQPTSSNAICLLSQHDDSEFFAVHSDFCFFCSTRTYCATRRRDALGEKEARR